MFKLPPLVRRLFVVWTFMLVVTLARDGVIMIRDSRFHWQPDDWRIWPSERHIAWPRWILIQADTDCALKEPWISVEDAASDRRRNGPRPSRVFCLPDSVVAKKTMLKQIDQLEAHMRAEQTRLGWGVAAPHVGVHTRLALTGDTLLLNPRIKSERGKSTECIVGMDARDRETVRYSKEMTVEYEAVNGNTYETTYKNEQACVVAFLLKSF